MKKTICIFLSVLMLLCFTACGEKKSDDKAQDSTVTSEKLNIDSDDSDYDPYAIVDYENPLTDVGSGTRHIPKIAVNLDGANTLSDKIKAECDEHFASDAEISYSFEVQYDVLQIIVTAKSAEKTEYMVFYYDALSDGELSVYDFISFCSLLYATIEDEIENQTGSEIDEDYIDYIVYHGDDKYSVYCSDKEKDEGSAVYECELEKTEIDISEIMSSVTA